MVGDTTSTLQRLSRSRFSSNDRSFYNIVDILLLLVFLAVLYPIVYIFASSFSHPEAVAAGRVWLWPVRPSLEGYKAVFKYPPVLTGYANTLFYTVTGTTLNVVLTVMAAYPLSRKDFYGRNLIMVLYTFTMLFSGGLVPTYLLIRNLGMLDSRLAMILPTGVAVWNLIITRTFFQTNLSQDLLDSARMEGCSDIRFLVQIALPLSKAVIAVITLFYAVSHWNAFFNAFLYLSDRDKYPLQLVLREILIINAVSMDMIMDPEEEAMRRQLQNLLQYALIVVACVPVWCVYPFIQRHFVKGVMIGAIKG
jgi:putative aldouronate transport system permease protein